MHRLLPYFLLVVSLLFTAQALPVLTARRTPTSGQDDVFTGRQGSPSITNIKPDSKKAPQDPLTASQASQPSTAPKNSSPQFTYDAIPGKGASQAPPKDPLTASQASQPSTAPKSSSPQFSYDAIPGKGASQASSKDNLTASQVSQASTAPKSSSPQFSYDAIPGKGASQASSNSKKVSGRYSDNPSTIKDGSQPPIAQNQVATDGATNGSTGTLNGSTGKDGSQAGSSQNVPINLDSAPKPKYIKYNSLNQDRTGPGYDRQANAYGRDCNAIVGCRNGSTTKKGTH